MTEEIGIKLTTELDARGLAELRSRLNESRNELNSLARETEKGSQKWKEYKATVQELNRLIKASDADLKRYASSMVQTEQAVTKVNNAKTKLVTNTDKLTKSFSNLKTNVGSYSTTIVNLTGDIARGDKTMLESIGTLGLYAGGWAAVASGIYLAIQNLVEWENTNSKVIQNRQANTPQTSVNRGFGQYEKSRPPGVGMFGYNLGPTWDNSNVQYEPTWESLSGPQQAEILQRRFETKSNLGGSKNIQKAIEDKIEQAKALELQGGARLIFGEIQPMDVNASNDTLTPVLQDFFKGSIRPIDTGKTAGQIASQTLEDTQNIYSAVSSTMSVLGTQTDSFVGKLIGGFGTVLTIMEAIKAVNSIFSFIPGFASGGTPPIGTPFWVGERGPELMMTTTPSYVMNHNDSMRMANKSSSSPDVKLYLNANVDISASLRKEQKRYNYITVKK